MLSMLNFVKVLISKEELRIRRGIGVNREQLTAIECISADGRHLPHNYLACLNTPQLIDHSSYSRVVLCPFSKWIY
jgi:hypothetical protein